MACGISCWIILIGRHPGVWTVPVGHRGFRRPGGEGTRPRHGRYTVFRGHGGGPEKGRVLCWYGGAGRMNGVGVFLGPIPDGAAGNAVNLKRSGKLPQGGSIPPKENKIRAPARPWPGGETRPRHGRYTVFRCHGGGPEKGRVLCRYGGAGRRLKTPSGQGR